MNKEKLNDYSLMAGIHTLCIRTTDNVDLLNQDQKEFDCVRWGRTDMNGVHTLILNPNKYHGYIRSYSEFKRIFYMILDKLGISNYSIVRCDMCFDSQDDTHYKEYYKLHRYILSLLETKYSVQNAYRSCNLISEEQCSIAIKNQYFEVEYYDKHYESNGRDAMSSRLELRSKRIRDNDIEDAFLHKWGDRFDRILSGENIKACLDDYNSYLEKEFRCVQRFYTMPEFVRNRTGRIFTRKQLSDLLKKCGDDSPESSLKNYKYRYNIEYISDKDLNTAISKIMNAMTKFFAT